MIDCTTLPGHLQNICNGTHRKANSKLFSSDERSIILSRFLKRTVSIDELPETPPQFNFPAPSAPPKLVTSFNRPLHTGQIGTKLKDLLEKKAGATIDCGECKADVLRLDRLTKEQVLLEKQQLATKIVSRMKTKAPRFWQRWAATLPLASGIMTAEITSLIEQACNVIETTKEMKLNWAYGITTVPSRLENGVFERTLVSLKSAGFDQPRLFVDGPSVNFDKFNLEITTRTPVIKPYLNWFLGLWELYGRNPTADRYAMFQDDFVTYPNLKKYLEQVEYPSGGYCNLFTFQCNQQLANGREGWYHSDQFGKSAVALVFDNKAVQTLLQQPHMIERPQHALRGFKNIDGGVITAMKAAGFKEYVHNPSLVQHTGKESTLGHGVWPDSPSFRGENWDVLSLLKKSA